MVKYDKNSQGTFLNKVMSIVINFSHISKFSGTHYEWECIKIQSLKSSGKEASKKFRRHIERFRI